jgi:SAM-dependent methyltransferase
MSVAEVASNREPKISSTVAHPEGSALALLFLASFVALYFELLVIRYLSTEIRIFAYLKNLPLIASFLGIGVGMILGVRTRRLRSAFPGSAAFFFLMIWACIQVGANYNFALPTGDYGIWNNATPERGILSILGYFLFVGGYLYLVVRFFIPLGGMVGEYMALERSALRAYGVNLLGSFAGIAAFTLLSFSGAPPWVWLLLGFVSLLPLLPRTYVTVGLLTAAVALTSFSVRRDLARCNNFWSPYYHISLVPGEIPPGSSDPAYYRLRVNYDYHQTILNLSNDFLSRYPQFEPNRSALPAYNLPFQLVPAPADVLIVGAGTGNDVAAALRNGATHVDAVEIDPTILSIGRRYHPEHPYDSKRVSTYVNDARAFFKQAPRKYDLILFAYLDSHTMFSSFSSLRLDNYVYTQESFEEARKLLKPDGTMVLAFASGRTLVTARIFATLQAAFDTPPRTIETSYDTSGIIFVEGHARGAQIPSGFADITQWAQSYKLGIARDSWPFLYLPRRQIPWPIWSVLTLFLCAAFVVVRRLVPMEHGRVGTNLHFFLLGAGFLLLETKGVTELSLLFGSTWVVNSIVIGAFLCMALLSNLLVMKHPVPYWVAYGGVFFCALLSTVFPYASLNSYPVGFRIVAASLLTALPVFFSGIVFSRSLSRSPNTNQALGVNLIGAIFGGTLESAVMIGGTGVLGPIAILLYLGSAAPLLMGGFGPSMERSAPSSRATAI